MQVGSPGLFVGWGCRLLVLLWALGKWASSVFHSQRGVCAGHVGVGGTKLNGDWLAAFYTHRVSLSLVFLVAELSIPVCLYYRSTGKKNPRIMLYIVNWCLNIVHILPFPRISSLLFNELSPFWVLQPACWQTDGPDKAPRFTHQGWR